jgi:formamidopyrimidine-DNA glycosylase
LNKNIKIRRDYSMLEIPESHTIAEQLNEAIKGKKIITVATGNYPHKFALYYDDPNEYDDLLKGKIIEKISAYGGLIEIIAEDTKIVFGDGANIRYLSKDEEIPEKNQLLIKFDDLSSLTCSTQMYAQIHVAIATEYDYMYYDVAKEKPSPLSDDFNREYFESLIGEVSPNASVKSFLATKQRIPGLGNGTLQDILFNAKIHPKTKIKKLTLDDKDRLFESVKKTLKTMRENKGRNTEKTLFGEFGEYETILSSKTFKNPCQICGDKILKESYLGGTIYYCPICQPLVK